MDALVAYLRWSDRMLRFSNGASMLEMEMRPSDDVSLASLNGADVVVRIASHGYAGSNRLWVSVPELELFAQALAQLEGSLRGEAVLRSMSPDELDLRVFAASSLGHLAVQCSTGHWVHGDNRRY